MKTRFILTLLVCVLVGILQVYASVSLVGVLAVLVVEHQFFGHPVNVIMAVETFLAWVPLNVLIGFGIGWYLKRHAYRFSLFTVVSAFCWLMLSVADSWTGTSLTELLESATYMFTTAGIYLLVSTLIGTHIAVLTKRKSRTLRYHAGT